MTYGHGRNLESMMSHQKSPTPPIDAHFKLTRRTILPNMIHPDPI